MTHSDMQGNYCVFSILSDDCALVLEEMIGSDSPTRRLVDEFTLVNGKYELSRSDIEFEKSGFICDTERASEISTYYSPSSSFLQDLTDSSSEASSAD